MGLEIGYEGYDGNERWMNEVGIKKWVAWWCRENGFNRWGCKVDMKINGTGGGMNLMRRPEKDHRGCVHGLCVHGRI